MFDRVANALVDSGYLLDLTKVDSGNAGWLQLVPMMRGSGDQGWLFRTARCCLMLFPADLGHTDWPPKDLRHVPTLQGCCFHVLSLVF